MQSPERRPRRTSSAEQLGWELAQIRLFSVCLAWIIILVSVLLIMCSMSLNKAGERDGGFSQASFYFSWFGKKWLGKIDDCSNSMTEWKKAECEQDLDEKAVQSGGTVNNSVLPPFNVSDAGSTIPKVLSVLNTSRPEDHHSLSSESETLAIATTAGPTLPLQFHPTTPLPLAPDTNTHRRVRRDTIDNLFDEYYQCITLKNKLVFGVSPEPMEALLLQQGQSVTLSCNLCTRPDQDINRLNVQWRRRLLSDGGDKETVVVPDDDRILLSPDKSLVLSLVGMGDTGYYTCYRQGSYEAMYHLDVVSREQIIAVYESGDEGPQPQKTVESGERNLVVFTGWSAWGPCNTCDQPGQRHRFGLCKVKKLNKDKAIHPDDFPGLSHYEDGLPCRSALLPSHISNLPLVRRRPSEKEIGYCDNPCPTVPPYRLITDEYGEVVEVVETGHGYMSMREGKPTFPPLAKRKSIYRELGKPIILSCPHEDSLVVEIKWQNSSHPLEPKALYKQSRGRVEIDINNRLIIKRLRFTDTATYSCWVKNKLVASYSVRAIEQKNRNMKDYIVFAGFGLVILVTCMIACNVARLQKKRGRSMK